jgi:hypothetical protein
MHHESNHLTREDATTPCVTVSITVHVEDGIDLHTVCGFVCDVAAEAADSIHRDAHPDEIVAPFIPPTDPNRN